MKRKKILIFGAIVAVILFCSNVTAIQVFEGEVNINKVKYFENNTIKTIEKIKIFLEKLANIKEDPYPTAVFGALAGLIFGFLTWIPALILSIPGSVLMGLYVGILMAEASGISAGIIMGILAALGTIAMAITWPFYLAKLGFESPV